MSEDEDRSKKLLQVQSSSDSSLDSASQAPSALLDRVSAQDMVRWMENINISVRDTWKVINAHTDALKRLGAWFDRHGQELRDMQTLIASEARKAKFRDEVHTSTIRLSSESTKEYVEVLRMLAARVDEAASIAKLAAVMTKAERDEMKKIAKRVDDTGEFMAIRDDKDEINAHHIHLRWSTALTWAKTAPVAAKAAGLVIVTLGSIVALFAQLGKLLNWF